MAVASTRTLLPLDRFFRLAGVNPLHANQVTVSNLASADFCGVPILQYSWQDSDRTGREEIAQTIADVETRLMEYLKFSLKPDYQANVPAAYPRPRNPELYSTWVTDPRGLVRSVWLGQGYLVSGGQETKDYLGSFPVTYTDVDGDGYFETATVTVTGFDPATVDTEIALYYPHNNGDDTFEIRPIYTTINSGVATVMARREQFVITSLLFGLAPEAVDGLDDNNFYANVDVYRHWLDPSKQQVEFRWQNVPYNTTSGAVQYSVQTGAMLVTDQKLGWAALEGAHWDVATQQYIFDMFNVCRSPDNVRLWFKAGWPLDRYGNMDGVWERCVTYLTLSLLDRPLCQCSSLRTFTESWAKDLAVNTQEQTRQISRRFLDCPLGTTKAAQYAWDAVRRYQLPDTDGAQ